MASGRIAGQTGSQHPTLRPYPRKTGEAGPEALLTSSLPNRHCWMRAVVRWGFRHRSSVIEGDPSAGIGPCVIGGWTARL
jgi:hypothetical protein